MEVSIVDTYIQMLFSLRWSNTRNKLLQLAIDATLLRCKLKSVVASITTHLKHCQATKFCCSHAVEAACSGAAKGGGGRPPPQCFSECSFRFVQIRWIEEEGGWKIVSRQCCVSCVNLFTEYTDLCSNIKLYVTMFFEVIKSQTTVSYVIYWIEYSRFCGNPFMFWFLRLSALGLTRNIA